MSLKLTAGCLEPSKRLGTFTLALAISLGFVNVHAQELSLEEEFTRELKLVESFKVYNEQLRDQIASQEQASIEIKQSIADAELLKPQISPLLSNMISALEQFVDADLPYHFDERKQSVQKLGDLMQESSVSDSERLRQVLDIYTIETEYGQSFEAYSAEINEQPVDILRIGRLALFAQTKDQSKSFSFNKSTREWDELDEAENRNIRKAIKVAAKTIAPELLSLPIAAPSSATSSAK